MLGALYDGQRTPRGERPKQRSCSNSAEWPGCWVRSKTEGKALRKGSIVATARERRAATVTPAQRP